VLWRVILAVLAIVGGSGLILYLLGVLLIPREGDTASPMEGLLGRGHSSTSPFKAVLIIVLTAVAFVASVSHNFPVALLVVALVVAVALLVAQGDRGLSAGNGAPMSGPTIMPMAAATPPGPPASISPPPPQAYPPPTATATEPGERPPFAPYGPYGPYVATAAPPPPVFAPVPPKPRPPRSRLGRITLSVALLALGVLTAFDLAAGVRVPFPAYVAVALGTVGLGLVAGAWFGRARGLIAMGLVLTVALGVASAAESVRGIRGGVGTATWPLPGEELKPRYELAAGDSTLDLTGVDFTGQDRTIVVRQGLGSMRVLLPPNVDTTAEFNVDFGQVTAFGSQWDAHAQPHRTVVDTGVDGTGGGTLHLIINLKAGDVEVHR
jgi:hypothetical protein